MKKVLIFSTAYLPFVGGAEIAVKEITDRLAEDFNFDLITLNLDGKQLSQETIGNVTVYRIGGPGKISKLLFPFYAYQLAKKLHSQKPYQLIWSIMASFGGFAARLFKKKFPNVPYVLTLQEGDPIPEIEHKVRFVKTWFKEIFTLADSIQVISNYLGTWAKDMGAKACITVIPNGVDFFWFNPEETPIESTKENFWKAKNIVANKIIVTTSRLVQKNAIDVVIESLKHLPEFHFVVLGVGPLEKKLVELTEKLELQDRLHFMGFIPNSTTIHYLHHSDVFVRPSRSEGMGNSFIEAMAAELPVVATPVGGIVDFLVDGETGLFCEVDNPKSIADAVMKYENNPELKAKIIHNAKEMVKEKYDWNIIARDMKEKVFDPLLVN